MLWNWPTTQRISEHLKFPRAILKFIDLGNISVAQSFMVIVMFYNKWPLTSKCALFFLSVSFSYKVCSVHIEEANYAMSERQNYYVFWQWWITFRSVCWGFLIVRYDFTVASTLSLQCGDSGFNSHKNTIYILST